MLRRILCIIGILWGSGMIISVIARGGLQGGGPYATGQLIGVGLAVLMIIAGLSGLRGKKDKFD